MPDLAASAPVSAPAPDPWRTWEALVLDLENHGHGHVLPRPDGMAQKCRKAPDCPVCLAEVRGLQRALAVLLKTADDGREAIVPLRQMAHGAIITQPRMAFLGEIPTDEAWPPPERAMFDVFPGQLRLDPGEPLQPPQGPLAPGRGWYRMLESITYGGHTVAAGTVLPGTHFSTESLHERVAQGELVPCREDGMPIWPRKDASCTLD